MTENEEIADIKKMQKGVFVIGKVWSIPTDVSMYECVSCRDAGIPHKIVEKPGPACTSNGTFCMRGDPTTIHVCTGCNRYTGPWVPAPW